MLTIILGPQKSQIMTEDQKVMTVFPTFVPAGDDLQSLHARTDYSEVEDVGIFVPIRIPLIQWFWVAPLSPLLRQGIVRFLREYHAKQDVSYDCYTFVNDVYGVREGYRATLWQDWDMQPLPRRQRVGDVVFLLSNLSDGMHFHHAAIYIGHKLYISVWGAGGDLEIATLPDMVRDYSATEVMLASPKNKKS